MNREAYKSAHSAIRKEARDRALRHAASVRDGIAMMAWRHDAIGIRVTRTATGRVVRTEPASVYHPTICDRAPRQRIAEALKWARYYLREARSYAGHRDSFYRGNSRLRAISISAARSCLADARALQTAFARLP